MSPTLPAAELLSAYRVLFGVQGNPALVASLREASLKKAFRRRALETHPDRARAACRDVDAMTRRFQEVSASYELLCAHLAARASPRRAPETKPAPYARPTTLQFWGAGVPERQLLLGQYLYYSRRISWQALIGAISWQRLQRPHFGQLATRCGFLTADRVSVTLRGRRPQERIGEAAVRLGLLTSYQRDVVVGLQRRAQRPLGEYFVQAGLLSRGEIERLVRELAQHNVGRRARAA